MNGVYKPHPNRRVDIPKEQGKFRTLQIPCIRDRVVQGALKLILEAIFEADFCPNSHGFRPKRSPHRALAEVGRSLMRRMTTVIDVDLAKYLDPVSYCPPVHEVQTNSSLCRAITLMRSPFFRPRVTTRDESIVGIDGAIAALGEACRIARPLDAEPPVLERGLAIHLQLFGSSQRRCDRRRLERCNEGACHSVVDLHATNVEAIAARPSTRCSPEQ